MKPTHFIPFTLLISTLLLSCSPSGAPVYTGERFGRSMTVTLVPYPISTSTNDYSASISPDGKWLYVGHEETKQGVVYRFPTDAGGIPTNPGTPDQISGGSYQTGMVAPGPKGNELVGVLCNRSEDPVENDCNLYTLVIVDDDIDSVIRLTQLNSDWWESSPTISSTGKLLFFCRQEEKVNGPLNLMMSRMGDDGWRTPVLLPEPIRSSYSEMCASTGFNDSVLFFTSNRPGGHGGYDIYVSFMEANGKWGAPFNLGPTVNTIYDERQVSVLPDNSGLLIASNRVGNDAEGMLDIYLVKFVR